MSAANRQPPLVMLVESSICAGRTATAVTARCNSIREQERVRSTMSVTRSIVATNRQPRNGLRRETLVAVTAAAAAAVVIGRSDRHSPADIHRMLAALAAHRKPS